MTGKSATPSGPKGEPIVDTSVAHPARVYDYLLGGGHNFSADRVLAENLLKVLPARDMARLNRQYLDRVVRYLSSAISRPLVRGRTKRAPSGSSTYARTWIAVHMTARRGPHLPRGRG